MTADPLLGSTLGDRYVIEALIGEGAMGRVYRARHRVFGNQRYAVKVLIGDLAATSTMRIRFAREAQNASRLDHPNVVNVMDFGKTERGLHYLVMDLVEGEPLAAIARRGPLPAERVIRIAHQLCEGLAHAHERGMIHRDFKSENILVVGEPGREIARIADFGLAMSVTRDIRLTTTGVACTPAYAAPEQLRSAAIDHRVDLYGLGVTLFEMLSGGYLPFEGDLQSTIAAKLLHEAPSILTRAPNVPPGLVTLVGRLLAHDAAQRPRSARAVIKALETSMTLPNPPIRTIRTRPSVPPGTRRRPFRSALLLCVLAALGSLSVYTDDRVVATAPRVAAAPAPESFAPIHVQFVSADDPPPPEPSPDELAAAQEAERAARRERAAKARRARAQVRQTIVRGPEPTALEVATRYSAIGRQLAALQEERGDDSTLDLWPRYRRIRITEAMSSQDSRNVAAEALEQLQRSIEERSR